MYSGMVDGNLARTQHLSLDKGSEFSPPSNLVDIQLLKIHLLTVDNGGNDYFDLGDPLKRDRFISQTLAYGKIGLWEASGGPRTQAMSCHAYYTYHLAQKR